MTMDRAGRPGRPQAAVVGSGVAGLTAAYLLQRVYDVTLYEAEDRLGGHAHTHEIAAGGRMQATRGGHTWIHKYIFPGGQIPSLQAIIDVLRARTSLRVSADFPMGPHYARTLHEWRGQSADATEDMSELGFGPVFRRMWDLYLADSEAGFRAGYLDVHQLLLDRCRP